MLCTVRVLEIGALSVCYDECADVLVVVGAVE